MTYKAPNPNALIKRLLEYTDVSENAATIELSEDDIERLKSVLRTELSERDSRLLSIRYGLDGGIGHTLEETKKMLPMSTSERVRQAEAKSIHKLRVSEAFGKISPILERHGLYIRRDNAN